MCLVSTAISGILSELDQFSQEIEQKKRKKEEELELKQQEKERKEIDLREAAKKLQNGMESIKDSEFNESLTTSCDPSFPQCDCQRLLKEDIISKNDVLSSENQEEEEEEEEEEENEEEYDDDDDVEKPTHAASFSQVPPKSKSKIDFDELATKELNEENIKEIEDCLQERIRELEEKIEIYAGKNEKPINFSGQDSEISKPNSVNYSEFVEKCNSESSVTNQASNVISLPYAGQSNKTINVPNELYEVKTNESTNKEEDKVSLSKFTESSTRKKQKKQKPTNKFLKKDKSDNDNKFEKKLQKSKNNRNKDVTCEDPTEDKSTDDSESSKELSNSNAESKTTESLPIKLKEYEKMKDDKNDLISPEMISTLSSNIIKNVSLAPNEDIEICAYEPVDPIYHKSTDESKTLHEDSQKVFINTYKDSNEEIFCPQLNDTLNKNKLDTCCQDELLFDNSFIPTADDFEDKIPYVSSEEQNQSYELSSGDSNEKVKDEITDCVNDKLNQAAVDMVLPSNKFSSDLQKCNDFNISFTNESNIKDSGEVSGLQFDKIINEQCLNNKEFSCEIMQHNIKNNSEIFNINNFNLEDISFVSNEIKCDKTDVYNEIENNFMINAKDSVSITNVMEINENIKNEVNTLNMDLQDVEKPIMNNYIQVPEACSETLIEPSQPTKENIADLMLNDIKELQQNSKTRESTMSKRKKKNLERRKKFEKEKELARKRAQNKNLNLNVDNSTVSNAESITDNKNNDASLNKNVKPNLPNANESQTSANSNFVQNSVNKPDLTDSQKEEINTFNKQGNENTSRRRNRRKKKAKDKNNALDNISCQFEKRAFNTPNVSNTDNSIQIEKQSTSPADHQRSLELECHSISSSVPSYSTVFVNSNLPQELGLAGSPKNNYKNKHFHKKIWPI